MKDYFSPESSQDSSPHFVRLCIAHISREVSHCVQCRIPPSLQLQRGGKEDCWWTRSHRLSVVIIKRLHVFPQQSQHCLICTLICTEAQIPPVKPPVPEALTGYYKVQNLTQKGYILMKLEEINDLLHTWLFAEFFLFTGLKLLIKG